MSFDAKNLLAQLIQWKPGIIDQYSKAVVVEF